MSAIPFVSPATTLLLFALSTALSLAQPIARDRSANAGFDAERLEKMHAMVKQHIDDNKHAGAVTLVARNGKIADVFTVGYRDLEAKAPMTPDTIFRIYSMSKIITSVAAMMLFEEGRFGLDDPVTDYVPELRNVKVLNSGGAGAEQGEFVRLKRPITIRHLLTHTAGLTYDFSAPEPLRPHW